MGATEQRMPIGSLNPKIQCGIPIKRFWIILPLILVLYIFLQSNTTKSSWTNYFSIKLARNTVFYNVNKCLAGLKFFFKFAQLICYTGTRKLRGVTNQKEKAIRMWPSWELIEFRQKWEPPFNWIGNRFQRQETGCEKQALRGIIAIIRIITSINFKSASANSRFRTSA